MARLQDSAAARELEADRQRIQQLQSKGGLGISEAAELGRLSQRVGTSGELVEGVLDAANIRAEAGEEALGFLDPFRQQFQEEDIQELRSLATDPTAQVNFLQNNPLFESLMNQAKENTFRTQSAGGALGSSGTDEILQNQFLTRGNELITQQINRQLPLLRGATGATTGAANLLTGVAEAEAGGIEDAAQTLVTGRIADMNRRRSQSDPFSTGLGLATSLGFSPFSEAKV